MMLAAASSPLWQLPLARSVGERRMPRYPTRPADWSSSLRRWRASSRPGHPRASGFAPELLLGWPRAIRREEQVYLLHDIAKRPEVGRLTGRGNTANLEVVLASKPDLILDVGSTDATYVSLADRVQAQTGIAYALLDGRKPSGRVAQVLLAGEIHRRLPCAPGCWSQTVRTEDRVLNVPCEEVARLSRE